MTGSTNEPALCRNNSNRSVSDRNNNGRPTSGRNDSNNKVDRFGDGGDGVEYAKKSGKSKGKKLSKFRKSTKSRKNLSKSENSSNFGAMEAKQSFLTPESRAAFNRLWLAFIKALILWYFDPECHIWIETDALGYGIGEILNQQISKTSPNGVVTKVDLS